MNPSHEGMDIIDATISGLRSAGRAVLVVCLFLLPWAVLALLATTEAMQRESCRAEAQSIGMLGHWSDGRCERLKSRDRLSGSKREAS